MESTQEEQVPIGGVFELPKAVQLRELGLVSTVHG